MDRRRHYRIWQKKAYVVQGCGERLQKVKQDFMNYDVEQLVSLASAHADLTNIPGDCMISRSTFHTTILFPFPLLQDCVVWMKTTDGKIQHLYAGTYAPLVSPHLTSHDRPLLLRR